MARTSVFGPSAGRCAVNCQSSFTRSHSWRGVTLLAAARFTQLTPIAWRYSSSCSERVSTQLPEKSTPAPGGGGIGGADEASAIASAVSRRAASSPVGGGEAGAAGLGPGGEVSPSGSPSATSAAAAMSRACSGVGLGEATGVGTGVWRGDLPYGANAAMEDW